MNTEMSTLGNILVMGIAVLVLLMATLVCYFWENEGENQVSVSCLEIKRHALAQKIVRWSMLVVILLCPIAAWQLENGIVSIVLLTLLIGVVAFLGYYITILLWSLIFTVVRTVKKVITWACA